MIVQAMMLQALGPQEMFRLMRIDPKTAGVVETPAPFAQAPVQVSPWVEAARRALAPEFARP